MSQRCPGRWRILVLSLATLFVAEEAHAEYVVRGFSADRFLHAESGSPFHGAEDLELFGTLRPSYKLSFDYGYQSVTVGRGVESRTVVSRHLRSEISVSLVIIDQMRVGLALPVTLWQSGQAVRVGDYRMEFAHGPSFGDVRLSFDGLAFGRPGSGFRLATGVKVFVPSGSAVRYSGDEWTRVLGVGRIAGDLGPVLYATHLGVMYRDTSVPEAALGPQGAELVFGLSVGVRLASRRLLVGAEFQSATSLKDMFVRAATPSELGVSTQLGLGGGWFLGSLIGVGLIPVWGTPEARGLMSVQYAPRLPVVPRDQDGDGVPDRWDLCPESAGLPSRVRPGCP